MVEEKKRAIFLDRDGVVNKEINYLYRIEDVEFMPGLFPFLKKAYEKGYLLIIVTNQAGIARGFYTVDDYHKLMNWMSEQFKKNGTPLTAHYFCPHHPDVQGPYGIDCECRKPKPGMILQAAKDWNIDLNKSILIGDKLSDIQAGEAAGLGNSILFNECFLNINLESS